MIKIKGSTPKPDGSTLLELSQVNLPTTSDFKYDDSIRRPLRHINVVNAWKFGDEQDGVIEFVTNLKDGQVESGYYFGEQKPKYIIKVSSQIGCPASCQFCEAGAIKFKRNLLAEEIFEQAIAVLQIAEESGVNVGNYPHKINFAGTGEPLFNQQLPLAIQMLSELDVSFKLSTVFPAQNSAIKNFLSTARFASEYKNSFQVQISLISTDESYRAVRAGNLVANFAVIRKACLEWYQLNPNGRKINLSLILAADTPADPQAILDIFPPELFRFRFRPYVPTTNGAQHLTPINESQLAAIRLNFRNCGYEVDAAATPTATEQRYGLASNVTLARSKK